MSKRLVAFNADFDEALDGTYWACRVFFNEPGTASVDHIECMFMADGKTPGDALGLALADAEKHGYTVKED